MSEFINNREFRKNTIKAILKELHEGKPLEEVKEQFSKAFDGVSAEEISQAEQSLIQEGLSVSEIQKLCDVHAEVFKGSIEEIHQSKDPSDIPGHPANTLKRENRKVEQLIDRIRSLLDGGVDEKEGQRAAEELKKLYEGLDRHYKKKENLLFPYLERYGVTAPPKVMWGVDDEIRALIKELIMDIEKDQEVAQKQADEALTKVTDMVFKEENILLPILLEKLTVDEWQQVALDSPEFGYCLLTYVAKWVPEKTVNPQPDTAQPPSESALGETPDGIVKLPTGSFTLEELTQVLNALPIDITFVGRDDTVRYFSQSNERIFPRTPSVIGRQVSHCHPPASVHIVEKLVEDFKNGIKDSEDFWIRMGEKYILIRYFAVRDLKGEYLGVLEVTQNIAGIKEITGEKRLVSE